MSGDKKLLLTVVCDRCGETIMRSFWAEHMKHVHPDTHVRHTNASPVAAIQQNGEHLVPVRRIKKHKLLCSKEASYERKKMRAQKKMQKLAEAMARAESEPSPIQRKMRARTFAIFEGGRFRLNLSESAVQPSRGKSMFGGIKPSHAHVVGGGLPGLGKRR